MIPTVDRAEQLPGKSGAMRRFLLELRQEWAALVRAPAVRGWLVALAVTVVVVYFAVWLVAEALAGRPQVDPDVGRLRAALLMPESLPLVLTVVYGVGTPLLMGAVTFGTDRVVNAVRASGGVRAAVAVVALLSLAVTGLLSGLVAGVGVSAVLSLGSPDAGAPDLGPPAAAQFVASLGRTSLVLAPYVAIAMTLTIVLRDRRRGLFAGLAVFFGEPLLVSLSGGAASGWLLFPSVQTLLRQNGIIEAYEGDARAAAVIEALPAGGQAAGVVAAYTVALALASYVLLRRRPGSDLSQRQGVQC